MLKLLNKFCYIYLINMNKLVLFLITLIIIIYINYYNKYNNYFQIIQLTSDKINQDILHEKLPILLEDPISNPNDFIYVLFTYEYIFKKYFKYNKNKFSNNVNKNLAYYLIFYNSSDNEIPIFISHPKYHTNFKFNKNNKYFYKISDYIVQDTNDINDTQFVQISIKPKQIFILPSYWLFYVNHNIDTYFLYGAFNLLLAFSKICF